MAVRLEIARWAGVRADLQVSNGEVTLSRNPLLDPALRGSQFNFYARSSEQVAAPSTRSVCALQGTGIAVQWLAACAAGEVAVAPRKCRIWHHVPRRDSAKEIECNPT